MPPPAAAAAAQHDTARPQLAPHPRRRRLLFSRLLPERPEKAAKSLTATERAALAASGSLEHRKRRGLFSWLPWAKKSSRAAVAVDAEPAEQLPLAASNGTANGSPLNGRQSDKDGNPRVTAVRVNGAGLELSPAAASNGHSA